MLDENVIDAEVSEIVSRPKIHRLPKLPPSTPQTSALSLTENIMLWRTMWSFAAVALCALVFVAYQNRTHLFPKNLTSGSTISSAQAAEFPDDDQTISIKDSSGTITGQLAKIPPDAEKSSNLKDMNNVNKPAGRDLLAIISRY